MPQHGQPAPDRAKLTMDTASMAYDAAKCLSDTRMNSVVDEDGARPEDGPKEILGSAILFAVAIELALNGLRMEEKTNKTPRRKGSKPKSAARHDLSVIFGSLNKKNREAIANEVALRGWKVGDVLDFHKAMVMDWRYPIDRASSDGALFWWGAEPLVATFEGILAAWKKRYPRSERVTPQADLETIKRRILTRRDEVKEKMDAARITRTRV